MVAVGLDTVVVVVGRFANVHKIVLTFVEDFVFMGKCPKSWKRFPSVPKGGDGVLMSFGSFTYGLHIVAQSLVCRMRLVAINTP